MRQHLWLVIAALVFLAPSLPAQQPPNFSGEWVAVDLAKVKELLDLGVSVYRGTSLTIKQDAEAITIAYEDQDGKAASMALKFDKSRVFHAGPRGVTYMSYVMKFDASGFTIVRFPEMPGRPVLMDAYSIEGDELKIRVGSLAGGTAGTILFKKRQ